jgi:hypothetical protein
MPDPASGLHHLLVPDAGGIGKLTEAAQLENPHQTPVPAADHASQNSAVAAPPATECADPLLAEKHPAVNGGNAATGGTPRLAIAGVAGGVNKTMTADPAGPSPLSDGCSTITTCRDGATAPPDGANPHPYPLSVRGTVPARQVTVMESPILLAYHNGRKIIGPLVKLWRLFWACHYGWLLPLDWYRWSIEGHESSEYVCLKATALPRRFGLVMHMRGKRFLTLGDWEQLEKAVGLVGDDAFHQMGSRFSRIFWVDRPEHLVLPLSLRPFFHYRIEETGDRGQPAYRMHPDRTWLLVLGVAPGQDVTDDDIDWSVFQTPPPSDVPDEQIDRTMFLALPSAMDDVAKNGP